MMRFITLLVLLAGLVAAQPTRDTTTFPFVRFGGGTTTTGNTLCWDAFGRAVSCAVAGEANTASNLGSGAGLFASKSGVDLRFKSLTAGSSRVTITGNTNDVALDLAASNILLSTLGGTLNISQLNTTGTANNTTYLRGDGAWTVVTSGSTLPSQTSNGGRFLRTDGTNAAWSFILTGPTGALDCSTGPCDLVPSVIPFLSLANTWTGANDYSGASFLRVVTGTGDPSTGCSVSGDVGKVYVRSDGAADNNLWVCENNGGTRRWRQPGGSGVSFATTDQGDFILGLPGGNAATALTQFQPRLVGFRNVTPQTVRQVTVWCEGTCAGNLRIGFYSSDCSTLLGQSNTTATSVNSVITVTFGTPASLPAGTVYAAIVSDHATGGVVRAVDGVSTLLGAMANAGATTPQIFTATGSGSITLPSSCTSGRTALSSFVNMVPAMYARP